MKFFNNINHLKSLIGGVVNNSVDESGLAAEIDNAAEEYILPYLDEDFFQYLLGKWEAINMTADEEKLVNNLQRSLGHFAVLEFITVGSVQLTDSGLTRQESEHHRSAYKYQEENLRAKLSYFGYLYLERTLKVLADNIQSFPTFSSEALDEWEKYKNIVPGLLNFAVEMKGAYGKNISRQTFETMRSILDDVMNFGIKTTVGSEMYESLYEKKHFSFLPGITSLSAAEKTALTHIQKAASSLSIGEAIKANLVQLQGEKIMIVNYHGTRLTESNATPPDAHLTTRITQSEIQANRHILDLLRYIDQNQAEFPLFQPWQPTAEAVTDQTHNPIFNF